MNRVSDAVLNHIESTDYGCLPPLVAKATKCAIIDAVACALIGSAEKDADILAAVTCDHFGYGGVPVWGTAQLLAPIAAAMVNGFNAHNSACACSHEETGLQPMSVILPVAMAYADREGRVGGQQFVAAVTLGVDIACLLGLSVNGGERLRSSGVCGAMGAGAALASLANLDRQSAINLFGLISSQMPDAMRVDTTPDKALKIAFCARDVLTAFDMTRRYLPSPEEPFQKDGAGSHPESLGRIWRVAEMSCKTFDGDNQPRDKFMAAAASAYRPLDASQADRLYGRFMALQDEADVSVLSHLLAGRNLADISAVLSSGPSET